MRDSHPGDPAKGHFATRRPQFQLVSRLSLSAAFDAGRLTSDGGLVWLSEADQVLGICEALAACIPDWRRGPVLHTLPTLVRQRVFQIACGYADQNDATTLRSDPLLKAACGRLPDSRRRSGFAADALAPGARRSSLCLRSDGRGAGGAVHPRAAATGPAEPLGP